jgi:phage tail protein
VNRPRSFSGRGERSIILDGVIYPEAFGGAELLTGIHAAARAGTVLAFIAMRDQSLQGDVMGMWIIKSIQNTRSFFGRNGPRKIEFGITLKSYGPDGAGFPGGLF